MHKIEIEDLCKNKINGVEAMLPEEGSVYSESFFEWKASSLTAAFATNEITGGVIRAWHHKPVFQEIETHIDREMFYFMQGTAIMLFVDIKDGTPDIHSAQIVRIDAGTQIIIEAGKGHFVAVAADSEPVCAVVVAPKMDAPRMPLPEPVEGIG